MHEVALHGATGGHADGGKSRRVLHLGGGAGFEARLGLLQLLNLLLNAAAGPGWGMLRVGVGRGGVLLAFLDLLRTLGHHRKDEMGRMVS